MAGRGDIDVGLASDVAAWAARTLREIQAASRGMRANVRVQADMEGFTRDVNGRLHDLEGRFIAEGRKAGKGFGASFGGGFGGALKGLGGALGGITKATAGFSKLLILPAALGAAAVSAGQFVAAIAPAAGLVAALPGVILGGAAALGTFKLAISGVSDAISAGFEGDMEAFQEALDKLAPSAQRAVKAIVALKPGFDTLKKSVQENFFAGFDVAIKDLATKYLPVLQKQLPAIAASMGTFATNFADAAGQAENVSAIDTILASTAKGLARANDGVGSLTTGFIQASAVAAPFLEDLGGLIGGLTKQFGDFLNAAAGDGRLQGWIENALSVLQSLGALLSNIGSIIGSVFSAASAQGGSLLDTLVLLTGEISTFLKSAEGAAALQAIFGALAQVGQVLSQTLGVVLPLLGQALVNLAPAVGPLAAALGAILQAVAPLLPIIGSLAATIAGQLATALTALAPIVGAVANVLGGALAAVLPQIASALLSVVSALAPLLVPLAQLIAQLVTGLVPVLTPLITLLGQIAGQIGGVLIQALGILLPPIIQLVGVIAGALMPVLQVLGDALVQILMALLPLLPPLVQLLGAIIPIIPMIANLAATLITALLPALLPIIELIVQLATLLISILVPVLNFLVQTILGPVIGALSTLLGWLGKILGAVVGWVAGFLGAITQIPGKVVSALGNLGSLLYNAGRNLIQGLINGVTSMISSLTSKLSFITNLIPDWKGPEDKDRRLLIPAGRAIMQGLGAGIDSQRDNLRDQLTGVTNDVGMNALQGTTPTGGVAGPGTGSPAGIRVWGNQPDQSPPELVIKTDGTAQSELMVRTIAKAVRVRGGRPEVVLSGRGGVST